MQLPVPQCGYELVGINFRATKSVKWIYHRHLQIQKIREIREIVFAVFCIHQLPQKTSEMLPQAPDNVCNPDEEIF